MGANPELFKLARHAVQKRGFVPSDIVAGGGGDPSGGGGGPPPGPPPGGDPSGGGGPPLGPPPGGDPSGGGAGPAPGGVDIMSALPQMIQQGVQSAMQQGGMQGTPGVAGTGGPGKPAKPDINTVAMDCFQLKKMFLHFLKVQGIDLPPDILDGPNRDPATGMPTPPDPTGGLGAQGGGQPPQSSIPPIQPMQGAFPAPPGGGGGGKMASASLADAHRWVYRLAASIAQAEEALVKAAEAYGLEIDPDKDPLAVKWPVKRAEASPEPAARPRVGEEINGSRVQSKAAAVALMIRRRNQRPEAAAAP